MLPAAAGERLGVWLGLAAYHLGWRRAVVESQLARAFPGRDASWVRSTARAAFAHVGREALSLAALLRGGLPAVRERVERFDGLEDLRSALAEGRGVVIVSGHLGNWELAGSALPAFGLPADVVMQRLKNPYLSRYVEQIRARLGMGLIDRVEAWDRFVASLERNRIVAFAADQDARRRGVFVPFFGRPASTHRAPALLALRARAPLFVGGVHRVGRRRYQVWVVRLEPRGGIPVGDRVLDLTERWVQELESRIRLFPDQYFWHHKRWKTPPPGTVPRGDR